MKESLILMAFTFLNFTFIEAQQSLSIACSGVRPDYIAEMNGEVFFIQEATPFSNDGLFVLCKINSSNSFDVIDTFYSPGTNLHFLETTGNRLFFFTDHSLTSSKQQLWTSNGLPGNTIPIFTTPGIASQREYAIFNNKLYFGVSDSVNSNEYLYVSDGTNVGTNKINSIGDLGNILVVDTNLFVIAEDLNGSNNLFRLNSNNTLSIVDPLWDDYYTNGINGMVFKNEIYYMASAIPSSNKVKQILTKFNPNTNVITRLDTLILSSFLCASNDLLYMHIDTENDPNYYDLELYATNGSVAGTYLVKELTLGYDATVIFEPIPADSNKIFFLAKDYAGQQSRYLAVSDGTSSGTHSILNVPNIYYPVNGDQDLIYGNYLCDHFYFTLFNSFTSQYEMYKTNGMSNNYSQVGINNTYQTEHINGELYVVVNDTIYNIDCTLNTGVDLKTKEMNILLYPNPSNGILNIENKENLKITSISIMDVQGSEVMNIQFNNYGENSLIDVSDLSSGIYFIRITINNDVQQTQKLIINK